MFLYHKNGTDFTLEVMLKQDNGGSNPGEAATGLTSASTGIGLAYRHPRSTVTTVTLSDLTNPDDAHSDGGMLEVDSTNAPGLYRFDLPDAAFPSGEEFVTVYIKADAIITRSITLPIQTAHAYNGVYTGSDFLQADAQQVGGATPDDKEAISDQIWTETLSDHSGTGGSTAEEIASHATSSEVTALNDPTAAVIADTVLEEVISDHSGVSGSLAESLANNLDAAVSSRSSHDAAAAASSVWSTTSSEPTSVPALGTDDLQAIVEWVGIRMLHKITQDGSTQTVRDAADTTDVGTATVSDDGTTAERGKFS